MPRILGILLAGGRGDRLQSLRRARTEAIDGARLVRAIVDRYNHVPPGSRLQPDAEGEEGLSVHRDPSGLVVVPRGESLGPVPRPA